MSFLSKKKIKRVSWLRTRCRRHFSFSSLSLKKNFSFYFLFSFLIFVLSHRRVFIYICRNENRLKRRRSSNSLITLRSQLALNSSSSWRAATTQQHHRQKAEVFRQVKTVSRLRCCIICYQIQPTKIYRHNNWSILSLDNKITPTEKRLLITVTIKIQLRWRCIHPSCELLASM